MPYLFRLLEAIVIDSVQDGEGFRRADVRTLDQEKKQTGPPGRLVHLAQVLRAYDRLPDLVAALVFS